jgi:N-acetylglucosamine malate deacetylase 1
LIPTDPAKQQERRRQVRAGFERRSHNLAERFRAKLADFYGPEKAGQVQYAEAFEICEYGRRPDKAELKKLFPFFGE